jgi:hypothetical protein
MAQFNVEKGGLQLNRGETLMLRRLQLIKAEEKSHLLEKPKALAN